MKPRRALDDSDVKSAVRWWTKETGTGDWSYEVYREDDPPDWTPSMSEDEIAVCETSERFKTALVWISPDRHREGGADELASLFHELHHAAFEDAGMKGDDGERGEALMEKFGSMHARLYRLEGEIKGLRKKLREAKAK